MRGLQATQEGRNKKRRKSRRPHEATQQQATVASDRKKQRHKEEATQPPRSVASGRTSDQEAGSGTIGLEEVKRR